MSSLTSVALRPSAIRREIGRCLNVGLVPVVRSSPGLGKSEIIQSIANKANLKLVDFRLGQADITDLNGLPEFFSDSGGQRRARYVPFEDFPLESEKLPLDDNGNPMNGWLLFFDEITSAQKQIQAAAYKILLERKVGQHKLHDKVWMAAAGNLETDNAVTHGMSTALQSRIIHLDMAVDKDDWIEWAIANDVDKRIIAFIEFSPGKLHEFNPSHTDRTFPCPRTWRFADLLTNGRNLALDTDLAILTGTIGPGAAMEYIQFTRIFETLPKLDEIIAAPESTVIPNDASTRYALAVMLAEYFDKSNAGDLIKFVNRLPIECRMLCVRMVAANKPQLIQHPALSDIMKRLLRM